MLAIPVHLQRPPTTVRTAVEDPAGDSVDHLVSELRRCTPPVQHVSIVRVDETSVDAVLFTDTSSLASAWARRHVEAVIRSPRFDSWTFGARRPPT